MQRTIFERQDAPRNSPAATTHVAVREHAREFAAKIKQPPTPRELFFEAGIVLAVALATGVAVQLVLGRA